MSRSLGIIGAGKLGMALARTAVAAGLEPIVAARDAFATRLIVEVMAPGARVGTLAEVAAQAEIIILAVHLVQVQALPPLAFEGRILVDAINFWEPVDGPIERFGVAMAETTKLIKAHFAGARVVKGLNQLGYHDVDEGRRPPGAPDRLAVALAADDSQALAAVAALVDRLGFDPVVVGGFELAHRLGPGGPAFGATLDAAELRRRLELEASRSI